MLLQEPGEMEEDFDSMDTEDIFKIFLSIRDPAPPIIPKEVGMRGYPIPDSLPCWLSQESLSYYATKFGKKGFTGGFNYFRALPLYVLHFFHSCKIERHIPCHFCIMPDEFLIPFHCSASSLLVPLAFE